ncbi:MAG: hypothetical protein MUD08_03350 [Cytophagales bacterium]|jgi:hypothetical protein|nr:hypothetical protein [Cytophagales bacterium]
MDNKKRLKRLEKRIADIRIQQESISKLAKNTLTTQAFNNAFVAILDKFQRIEEKQDQRWTQLLEKLDKMPDHEERLRKLEDAVFRKVG